MRVVDALAEQPWLDQASTAVKQAVQGAIKAAGPVGQQIEDVLHGTGLGHPLHPALTDLPVGAWTVALVFDALDAWRGDEQLAPGADTAIMIGLVGAVAAVATGLSGWQELDTKPLRLGLVQGAPNLCATLPHPG